MVKVVSDLKIGKCKFKQVDITQGFSENYNSLSTIVQELFSKGETKIIFKLDAVFGTSMFRLLHEAANCAADSKGKIFIIVKSEVVREMLELFGINNIIEIFESEKELESYCAKVKKFKQKRGIYFERMI